MNLAALLSALAWPLVSRVLLSMGLGVISYTGASAALSQLVNAAKATWSGGSADLLAILTIAGVFQAMAIIVGGITAGLALLVFKRIGLVSGT